MSNGCVEGENISEIKTRKHDRYIFLAVAPHSGHVLPEVKYGLVEKCEMSFEYLCHWPIFVQGTSWWGNGETVSRRS